MTGKPTWWLPLYGAALGAAGAGIYFIAARALPSPAAALACIVVWTAAGRIPHEGPFPYASVALAAAVKWLALSHFAGANLLFACIAAQAIPRAAMVGLAWVSRPAAGYTRSSTLTTPAAIIAIAQGILAAHLCGTHPALILILGSFVITRLVREYFYRRHGGVNADALCATEQLLEIFALTLFACEACAR